jgi:ParB family chromosome partitioning protein
MTRGKKERLGRGLGALLGDVVDGVGEIEAKEAQTLQVGQIRPNPFQPRKDFPASELDELARSIEENGLLQPLLVRPASGGRGGWELVAGERRLRAVAKLGWTDVPAMVREVDDRTLLVLALVENLQREALGPLEEAAGFQTLSETFGLTQGEIAEAVGKDRSTVANSLRLLKLPPSIRKLLLDGSLTSGHARALLSVEDSVRAGELARLAVQEGWSVRKLEEATRSTGEEKKKKSKERRSSDPVLQALEDELRTVFGTRVVLRRGKKGTGVVEIPFLDAEDFERIFALLAGREASEVVD